MKEMAKHNIRFSQRVAVGNEFEVTHNDALTLAR